MLLVPACWDQHHALEFWVHELTCPHSHRYCFGLAACIIGIISMHVLVQSQAPVWPSHSSMPCLQAAREYPMLQRALAHPCGLDGDACCGLGRADFILRFRSFFSGPSAVLTMAYEVWPVCGDGLDLSLHLRPQRESCPPPPFPLLLFASFVGMSRGGRGGSVGFCVRVRVRVRARPCAQKGVR